MYPFILGALAGMLLTWLLYARKRKQIKIAEEDKQLLQQEKQIVVEFMHNMVEAVSEGDDRETMFRRIVHAAVHSTGAMSACLFERREDDSFKGVAVEGLFPPQRKIPPETSHKIATRTHFLESILKSKSFKMGEGLIGGVAQSREALLIPDARSDPRVVQHEDPALQVRSIIVAPVLFRDQLLAVLAVANPSDGAAFNETDFSLVESLAEQVGLAIHNSEAMQVQIEKNRLDLDLELAGSIQSLLLPRHFPACENLNFATEYTAAQKIGGDLFDVFRLSDHKIGLAIADVSGKGVSASLLMAICQTNLRHLCRDYESPAAVLRAINAEMEQTMRKDMFITIIYAVIDLVAEKITLARAGHELPLYFTEDADGRTTARPVQSPGMALGMVPSVIFDQAIDDRTLDFGKNNALLLYTDGVTESVSESGEEYLGERLLDIFESEATHNARTLIQKIKDSIRKFSGSQGQLDDLTLIAVKHE